MSRTTEQVNLEYGQAAAELGQETYLISLAQEQIEKHEYKIERLKNNMRTLAKEAHALTQAAKVESEPSPAPESKEEVKNEPA